MPGTTHISSGMLVYSRIHHIHTNYHSSKRALEGAMARISSGDRFAISGHNTGGDLALSQRFRNRIVSGEQSTRSIQHGLTFIDQANAHSDEVINILYRMKELAASAVNPLLDPDPTTATGPLSSDRASLNAEYKQLKQELSRLARNSTFYDTQTIGREAIVSFNTGTEVSGGDTLRFEKNTMHFWNGNGGDATSLAQDFDRQETGTPIYGSLNSVDKEGNFIGFDPREAPEDYTMSRDGRSFFFLGYDAPGAGADLVMKKYDMVSQTVTQTTQTYDTNDKLFVDEEGTVFVSHTDTADGLTKLYTVDESSLQRSVVSNLTDMTQGVRFSVYKGVATYLDTNNDISTFDVTANTSIGTSVTDPENILTAPPAGAGNIFATGGVDHDISASGRYIADEVSDNVIRVIDTKETDSLGNILGNVASTITLSGTSGAVSDLQFSEDGSRLYYIDNDANEIRYINVGTSDSHQVQLSLGDTVVQGRDDVRLTTLSVGGSNFGSINRFLLSQDSTEFVEYEAIDLSLYNLGLIDTHIGTKNAANTALSEVQTAMKKATLERSRLGASASRLNHVLQSHENYIANAREAHTTLRDVDIAKETTAIAKMELQNTAAGAMISKFNEVLKSTLQLLNF